MQNNTPVTLGRIRASQDLSKSETPFLFRYVTIPLAWPLTWVFARLGFGPNLATSIRLAVTVAAFALLIPAGPLLHDVGLALFFLSVVLDHVDGQLCRVLDRASHFGKFFDGLVDSIAEIFLPIVIGAHIWLHEDQADALLAGGLAAIVLSIIQITLIRNGLLVQGVAAKNGSHASLRRILDRPVWRAAFRFVNGRALLVLWDLRYGGLLLAYVTEQLSLYVYVMAGAHILVAAVLIPIRLLEAFDRYDIKRQSQTARTTHS